VDPLDLPVQYATIRPVGSVLSELSKFLFQLRTAGPEDLTLIEPYQGDDIYQTFGGQIADLLRRRRVEWLVMHK
jgi:hypothetical protein